MSVGRYLWLLRRRVLGPERVVWKSQVDVLGRSSSLGHRGRARSTALLLRELVAGPPRSARIHVGHSRIELGGSSDFAVDWKAFVEIFGDDQYAAPYMGARVLDVGAHKGYFGAYALVRGASVVLSFEPAARNFEALARAARPLGDRWLVRNAAVGASAGPGVLLIDETSWAHSLVEVERPIGEQSTTVVTLDQALAELPSGGARTIVKIDAEGSECGILSRPAALDEVDVLLVEFHPAVAPCTAVDLARVVESAELALVSPADGVMRFVRR